MNCAWTDFLRILPPWMRTEVDKIGKTSLEELRLRLDFPPELVLHNEYRSLTHPISEEDLQYCLNASSKYSPWSAATSEKGYLTAPGGHRIGLCGQVALSDDGRIHIQKITSVCIRIARDFPGIAEKAADISGAILILGAPGWGKTTLLRDLCRTISTTHTLCVADERGELFPSQIPRGQRMDVLSGCPKTAAIEMLLRTMGPACIAVDEITAPEDCEAILKASNCGVTLLATAHASSVKDYLTRPVYRPLVHYRIFTNFLVLHPDKTYTLERIS